MVGTHKRATKVGIVPRKEYTLYDVQQLAKNHQSIKGKREIKNNKNEPKIKWATLTVDKNTTKEPNHRNKI